MFNLVRYNPFQELDKILGESFSRFSFNLGSDNPVNIYHTPKEVILFMSAPGAEKEDFELLATKDSLVVSGNIKSPAIPEDAAPLLEEQIPGKFRRAFKLPVSIQPDKVTATVKNGVLEIRLPKAEESKSYDIKVE